MVSSCRGLHGHRPSPSIRMTMLRSPPPQPQPQPHTRARHTRTQPPQPYVHIYALAHTCTLPTAYMHTHMRAHTPISPRHRCKFIRSAGSMAYRYPSTAAGSVLMQILMATLMLGTLCGAVRDWQQVSSQQFHHRQRRHHWPRIQPLRERRNSHTQPAGVARFSISHSTWAEATSASETNSHPEQQGSTFDIYIHAQDPSHHLCGKHETKRMFENKTHCKFHRVKPGL